MIQICRHCVFIYFPQSNFVSILFRLTFVFFLPLFSLKDLLRRHRLKKKQKKWILGHYLCNVSSADIADVVEREVERSEIPVCASAGRESGPEKTCALVFNSVVAKVQVREA